MHGKSVMLLKNCHHSELLANMVTRAAMIAEIITPGTVLIFVTYIAIVMKVLFLYSLKKNWNKVSTWFI